MKYNFDIEDLLPVEAVQLVLDRSIMFWYGGEDPNQLPIQRKDVGYGMEEADRPLLRDARTIRIFQEDGSDACIRHINIRIARYILDEFEDGRETFPNRISKLYEKKIDIFYQWFWERRQKGDEKLFARFLTHLRAEQAKDNEPATWHTLKEAAVYARTGVTKLRELIDEGKLRSYRLDDAKSKSTILIHRKDLDAVILFDRSSGLNKREQDRLKTYSK
mgnify:CR=1 FL=1